AGRVAGPLQGLTSVGDRWGCSRRRISLWRRGGSLEAGHLNVVDPRADGGANQRPDDVQPNVGPGAVGENRIAERGPEPHRRVERSPRDWTPGKNSARYYESDRQPVEGVSLRSLG